MSRFASGSYLITIGSVDEFAVAARLVPTPRTEGRRCRVFLSCTFKGLLATHQAIRSALAESYEVVAAEDHCPVATLLGSTSDTTNCPPCVDKAAFAEHLHVFATATDGWYRLSAYDAPRGGPTERADRAFALEPA